MWMWTIKKLEKLLSESIAEINYWREKICVACHCIFSFPSKYKQLESLQRKAFLRCECSTCQFQHHLETTLPSSSGNHLLNAGIFHITVTRSRLNSFFILNREDTNKIFADFLNLLFIIKITNFSRRPLIIRLFFNL